MDIKRAFSKAIHRPFIKEIGTELVDLMYGTLFRLQKGPRLTSDTLCTVQCMPSIDIANAWRTTITDKSHYVAKQNADGTWDAQRVSSTNVSELQYWTSRNMEIVHGSLEDVRTLFARNNQVVSPAGRGFSLTELDAEESCIAKGGLVKVDYSLVKLGNYREHPAWAESPAPRPEGPKFTP